MKILITGANRGLGLSLVKVGLRKGYIVFAAVRSIADKHIRDLQMLKEKFEGQLRIIHIDVTNEKSVKQASDAVRLTDKYIDIIINNAAILNERDKTIEELDLNACIKAFDVNTIGAMRVVKHFLPIMRADFSENKAIINISSEAGSITNAYSDDYPYGMSKAALNMFSEQLKAYVKDDEIKVLSIHPGWMRTDMGGEKAPKNPEDTAENIYKRIDDKNLAKYHFSFVNDEGNPMDI